MEDLGDEDRGDGRVDRGAAVHLGRGAEGHREGGVLLRDAEPLGDLLRQRHRADRGAGDERQLDGGPGAPEELDRVDLGDQAEEQRVDAEEDEGAADVDVDGERRVLAEQVPAVLVDGLADEADGADGREPDDPPQGLLEQFQDGAAEGEDRLGLVAELEGGDADDGGHEDDLHDLEFGERRDDVLRDDPGEEVQPGARVLGLGAVGGGQAGAGAGVGEQADDEADDDRDQRGHHEPEQGPGGEARGVAHVSQVGDGHQDREEDEGGDGQLQQLDEDAADLVQGRLEPGDVAALRGPAEEGAEDQAQQDLGPERHLGYVPARR